MLMCRANATGYAGPEGIVATLAELSEQMNVPDGYHVEIIAGRIVVSPTPQLGHAKIVRRLEKALESALPPGTDYYQNVTIVVAGMGEQYIPDLLVLPADTPDDQWRFDAGLCLLAVEVTSPKDPETDRNMKLRGYATAGVPLYLPIDVDRRSVTLRKRPQGLVSGVVRVTDQASDPGASSPGRPAATSMSPAGVRWYRTARPARRRPASPASRSTFRWRPTDRPTPETRVRLEACPYGRVRPIRPA